MEVSQLVMDNELICFVFREQSSKHSNDGAAARKQPASDDRPKQRFSYTRQLGDHLRAEHGCYDWYHRVREFGRHRPTRFGCQDLLWAEEGKA
jgi:hypothetical protein